MSDDTVSWYAAVDWGSEQHQACILDTAGKIAGERAFPHGGAGLVALCDWLVSVAGRSGSPAPCCGAGPCSTLTTARQRQRHR